MLKKTGKRNRADLRWRQNATNFRHNFNQSSVGPSSLCLCSPSSWNEGTPLRYCSTEAPAAIPQKFPTISYKFSDNSREDTPPLILLQFLINLIHTHFFTEMELDFSQERGRWSFVSPFIGFHTLLHLVFKRC